MPLQLLNLGQELTEQSSSLVSCNGPLKNLALDDKCLGQKTSVGEDNEQLLDRWLWDSMMLATGQSNNVVSFLLVLNIPYTKCSLIHSPYWILFSFICL